MPVEYLLFNILIVTSVLGSYLVFHKQVVLPHLKRMMLAIGSVAIPFILMDLLVTGHFWYFNPAYVLGVNVGSIPLEEALFFLTVPFACLFLWVNLRRRYLSTMTKFMDIRVPLCLLLTTGLGMSLYQGLFYSALVCVLSLLAIVSDEVWHTRLFRYREWYIFLGVVLLFTLVFNFYLTARPIVQYYEAVKSGVMILTIPLEDFPFGISLISLVISLYEFLGHFSNRVYKNPLIRS